MAVRAGGRCGRSRPFVDDEAAAFEMIDQSLCGDPRHGVVGMMDALAAIEAQGIGQRLLDLAGLGRAGRLGWYLLCHRPVLRVGRTGT